MTIGTSIVLIAVGAILKWAVTANVSWINLQTAGTVLFVLGIVGFVLAVIYTFYWSREHSAAARVEDERYERDPRYDR